MLQKIRYNTIELKKGTYSKKDLLRLKKRFKKIGELYIICPRCAKKSKIEIPMKLFKGKSNKLLSVIIPKGICCEHIFTVIIDQDLNVRAYEINDYIIKNHT